MICDIHSAFKAARRHTRTATQAMASARKFLAELAPAEARVTVARAAAAAVVDKRRYAPDNVAAQSELRSAEAALSHLRRILTPIDRGSLSMTLGSPWAIGGHKSAQGRWCENPPLRFVGLASDIVRLDHDGWYTDPYGDGETARGVVYQMVGREGLARYIPAIADPWNSASDGSGPAILVFGDMESARSSDEDSAEDARKDAARRADQLAEYYAKAEREYQAAWGAGQQWADKGQEVADTRATLLAVLAERKNVDGSRAPGVCALLRAKVGDMLETIAELREERAKLAAGETEPCYFRPGDRLLIGAFNEGAGETVLR